jgi:hypothetical protein
MIKVAGVSLLLSDSGEYGIISLLKRSKEA